MAVNIPIFLPFPIPSRTTSCTSSPDSHLSWVVLLLWSIWRSCDALIFKNDTPKPTGTLLWAKRSWTEWKLRTSTSSTFSLPLSHPYPHYYIHPKPTQFIRWRSPAGETIKINCDGAKSPRGASAGFVIHNWNGSFILAGACFLEQVPILVAEATTMKDGLKTAIDAGYRRIEVKGDNQVVINAIQVWTSPAWRIAAIIENIRNLIKECDSISFNHIYREGNMAADWVAKYRCTLRLTSLSCFSYPPSRDLLYILTYDYLGRSIARGTT